MNTKKFIITWVRARQLFPMFSEHFEMVKLSFM